MCVVYLDKLLIDCIVVRHTLASHGSSRKARYAPLTRFNAWIDGQIIECIQHTASRVFTFEVPWDQVWSLCMLPVVSRRQCIKNIFVHHKNADDIPYEGDQPCFLLCSGTLNWLFFPSVRALQYPDCCLARICAYFLFVLMAVDTTAGWITRPSSWGSCALRSWCRLCRRSSNSSNMSASVHE